jgi:signal transduction histidine kinase
LIHDLLDVSRKEAGRLTVEPSRISAERIASVAMDAQRSLAFSASLDLRLELSLPLPDLWGDWDRILQLFDNLIGNAIKFTPRGGSITVGAASQRRGAGLGLPIVCRALGYPDRKDQ